MTNLRIAIQPDRVVHKNGEIQSYSKRWLQRADETGVHAVEIDAYKDGAVGTVSQYDGFMWRFPPDADACRFAHVFMNSAESCLGKSVYPDWATRWHMEDKIGQSYALAALGVPVPRTTIIWRYEEAMEYVRSAVYPQVMKLSSGYQSTNVRLIRSRKEAEYFVAKMFTHGLSTLRYGPASVLRERARAARSAWKVLCSGNAVRSGPETAWHRGYMYLQEFVPDNDYDTRVTVIGDRAFGFVRRNRKNDFRASGSGLIDWNPDNVNPRSIELAFELAAELGTQTVAIDTVEGHDGEPLVLELTLSFASWAVARCPGHWRLLSRNPCRMEWREGAMRPEDAIFDDFVARCNGA